MKSKNFWVFWNTLLCMQLYTCTVFKLEAEAEALVTKPKQKPKPGYYWLQSRSFGKPRSRSLWKSWSWSRCNTTQGHFFPNLPSSVWWRTYNWSGNLVHCSKLSFVSEETTPPRTSSMDSLHERRGMTETIRSNISLHSVGPGDNINLTGALRVLLGSTSDGCKAQRLQRHDC